MKLLLFVALVAIAIGLSFHLEPEDVHEPKSIPFDEDTHGNFYSMSIRFPGGDKSTMLTGHLYLPIANDAFSSSSTTLPPVVVMAHGFGLVQSSGLMSYITAFQTHGMAVFTMDYATFGESDGLPRHTLCPSCHVADIEAAVDMLSKPSFQTTSGIDLKELINVKRIALWGTSLGGGHVIEAAASLSKRSKETGESMKIKAVISQVPHLASGLEALLWGVQTQQTNPMDFMSGVGHYALGLIRWGIGKISGEQTYYPMVGLPGTPSMMQNEGDMNGYLTHLAPKQNTDKKPSNNKVGWTNAATTESGVAVLAYRPMNSVTEMNRQLPIFLLSTENDTLCPSKYARVAHEILAGKATNPKHIKFQQIDNAGHFDIYQGKPLEIAIVQEVMFFKTHLL